MIHPLNAEFPPPASLPKEKGLPAPACIQMGAGALTSVPTNTHRNTYTPHTHICFQVVTR